jgi:hypothetical protein
MSVSIVDVVFMLPYRKPASSGNFLSPFSPCNLPVLWKSLCANLSIQKQYVHLLKMNTREHFFNIVVAKYVEFSHKFCLLVPPPPHN